MTELAQWGVTGCIDGNVSGLNMDSKALQAVSEEWYVRSVPDKKRIMRKARRLARPLHKVFFKKEDKFLEEFCDDLLWCSCFFSYRLYFLSWIKLRCNFPFLCSLFSPIGIFPFLLNFSFNFLNLGDCFCCPNDSLLCVTANVINMAKIYIFNKKIWVIFTHNSRTTDPFSRHTAWNFNVLSKQQFRNSIVIESVILSIKHVNPLYFVLFNPITFHFHSISTDPDPGIPAHSWNKNQYTLQNNA